MKKIRNTQSKTEIFKLINGSNTALSHSDIQAKLGDLCNRVTIYRVLERLEEEGKIHKIVNVDGVVNFAKCKGCSGGKHNHNHVHFYCEICKSVTCIGNVVPEIKIPQNLVVEQYNFVISGQCYECNI